MSQIVKSDAQCWQLTGELSFATVTQLLTEFTTMPAAIDLSQVTRTDSAGLALLIELRKRHQSIEFHHLPEQMLTLAKVSGVDEILSMIA